MHQGFYLIGPPPLQPQFNRLRVLRITRDGRAWIWFAGTGQTPPERVTAQIAAAARGAGFVQLADGAAHLVPQQLDGTTQRARQVLPGFTRGLRV